MAESQHVHRTVLLDEAVAGLAIDGPRRDGRYVDGTFGRGGHSRAILARLSAAGRLLAFDRDPDAATVAHALAGAVDHGRFAFVHTAFTALGHEVQRRGWNDVDGVLLDLGISSPQIDDPARGFSFRHDGPLDMRMDSSGGPSAADWLNSASSEDIERVIRDYGEERFAFQIAQAIVARRAERPLSRTRELADLVAAAVRPRRNRADATQDPATRTFQAVRIHVNQELQELEAVLNQALQLLAPGGRLAVIAFHSLEDRIVKRFIARQADPSATLDALDARRRRLPLRAADLPRPALDAIARVKPSAAEVAANPRSRSAVLRVAERTDAPIVGLDPSPASQSSRGVHP